MFGWTPSMHLSAVGCWLQLQNQFLKPGQPVHQRHTHSLPAQWREESCLYSFPLSCIQDTIRLFPRAPQAPLKKWWLTSSFFHLLTTRIFVSKFVQRNQKRPSGLWFSFISLPASSSLTNSKRNKLATIDFCYPLVDRARHFENNAISETCNSLHACMA